MKAKIQRKLRLLTDAEATCNTLIKAVNVADTPKPWWKFAIKASYIKAVILA
jgi:hypothetical protein